MLSAQVPGDTVEQTYMPFRQAKMRLPFVAFSLVASTVNQGVRIFRSWD
jgi:hypothetical protein